MLRPLSTYLLLIITCSFLMMSLSGWHLDNFVKSQSAEIIKVSILSSNNCSFIDATNQTLPAKEVSSFIGNFGLENEVEEETNVLPTIEFTSSCFNLNLLKSLFLNVYSTYSFTVIKIEFLDIFSPPPNC